MKNNETHLFWHWSNHIKLRIYLVLCGNISCSIFFCYYSCLLYIFEQIALMLLPLDNYHLKYKICNFQGFYHLTNFLATSISTYLSFNSFFKQKYLLNMSNLWFLNMKRFKWCFPLLLFCSSEDKHDTIAGCDDTHKNYIRHVTFTLFLDLKKPFYVSFGPKINLFKLDIKYTWKTSFVCMLRNIHH